ncbi:hypothetical protein Barb7_02642 [Bacteroidales bacterium Barb7]|nr:hypothetical protein Barb7_02642 [Bacteroidales bacterium Barb7]
MDDNFRQVTAIKSPILNRSNPIGLLLISYSSRNVNSSAIGIRHITRYNSRIISVCLIVNFDTVCICNGKQVGVRLMTFDKSNPDRKNTIQI